MVNIVKTIVYPVNNSINIDWILIPIKYWSKLLYYIHELIYRFKIKFTLYVTFILYISTNMLIICIIKKKKIQNF